MQEVNALSQREASAGNRAPCNGSISKDEMLIIVEVKPKFSRSRDNVGCWQGRTPCWRLPAAAPKLMPVVRHVANGPPRMPCTKTTSTTGASAGSQSQVGPRHSLAIIDSTLTQALLSLRYSMTQHTLHFRGTHVHATRAQALPDSTNSRGTTSGRPRSCQTSRGG